MNNYPIKTETILRAVAERDFGVMIEHVKHVPVTQKAYSVRNTVIFFQRHPQTKTMYAVDKVTRTLIIADEER